MLFSKEDLSLEHLPPFDTGFDPEEHVSPRHIFPQSNFSGFPRQAHYDTSQKQSDFLDKEWLTPLRLSQIAWQAFFDQIDFYNIGDEVTLGFFANMHQLAEIDPNNPVVNLTGSLGSKLYRAYADLKAVNDGALSFERFIGDDLNLTALKLLDNGYFPSHFNGSILVLEKEKPTSYRRSAEISETRRLMSSRSRHDPA